MMRTLLLWYRCPQFLPTPEPPRPLHYGEQRDA